MNRVRLDLSILTAFIIAFSALAGCATTRAATELQALDEEDDDPAPTDPVWQLAAKSEQGKTFRNGNEVCAIGRASDRNPTNGQETAEFGASIALADTLKLSSIESVRERTHRIFRWMHADNLTHETVLCIPSPGTLAAR
jgi:hypothetical protein